MSGSEVTHEQLQQQVDALRERIRQSERERDEYRLVASYAYDWEYWLAAEGHCQYISPSVERITGYPAESFVEDPGLLERIVIEEDRPLVINHIHSLTATGELSPIEFRIQRRDGGLRWIGHICHSVVDEEGRYLGRRATNRDITDRKQAEEEVRTLQSELMHMSRLSTVGQMASSLAHELNQPLCAILNNLDGCLARMGAQQVQDEQIMQTVSEAASQAERAGRIIRGMRNFARKRPPQDAPIDLAEAVQEALVLVTGELRRLKAEMSVDVPGTLPRVLADKVQVQQVLLNLVRNSLEAVQEKPEQRGWLAIFGREDETNRIRVTVADNGPGFSPPETEAPNAPGDGHLERVLEPFFTTKPQGLGMGLAICRSIVEAHGGELALSSRPQGGAEVAFTLPAVR